MVAVIGMRERDNNEASVRIRKHGEIGPVSAAHLVSSLQQAVAQYAELSAMEGYTEVQQKAAPAPPAAVTSAP